MTTKIRNAVGATLLGFAAAISSSTASAAIVTGSWDPVLPSPFVNLGWVTTINVKVDDKCINEDGETYGRLRNYSLFGFNFKCSALLAPNALPFEILRAQIGIYDTLSSRIIDVLDFDEDKFLPFSIEVEEGGVISWLLSLRDSDWVFGDVVGRTAGFEFQLALPGAAPAIRFRGADGIVTTPIAVPELTGFSIRSDSDQDAVLEETALRVPEPNSLTLALLAVAAAGLTASRRARRAG